MAHEGTDGAGRAQPASVIGRLPTGAKLFLILSIALLPLALIAIFAVLQSSRAADLETRARLRVAIAESSRTLAIELIGDMTALRATMNALEGDRADAPSCARIQGVFAPQSSLGTRFAILDMQGRALCGNPLPKRLSLVAPGEPGPIAVRLVPGEGLLLATRSETGQLAATAFFPTAFLTSMSRPSGFMPAYRTQLTSAGTTLPLQTLERHGPLEQQLEASTPLGFDTLALEMAVRQPPLTSSQLVAMLLPLLMWAGAAGIGWFVVDRLLIRPLRRLRSAVAAYRPGELLGPVDPGGVPAQEIRELAETFRAISRTVAAHEAELAEGLSRQTKLTREVHHRVKNNLQVIASLINLHARGARDPEATRAYASIQRRVDALAVVHRHHFAELEETRGLSLRSMIGELAASIRATAPDSSADLGISLDVDPFLVSQDVAVAVSFLLTELVELAMGCNPHAQIRISLKGSEQPGRAVLRASSPSLADGDRLHELLEMRYGRVMEGLSRQLRTKLHHDPLAGAYEASIAVVGRD